MNDETKKRRGGWYWWALLLPVFYVLSIRPFLMCFHAVQHAGYDVTWADGPYGVIYAPLLWASENSGLVERFLDWYINDLWQA